MKLMNFRYVTSRVPISHSPVNFDLQILRSCFSTDPTLLFDLIVEKTTEHERQYQRLKVKKRDQSENKKEKFKAKSEPSVEMKKKRPFGSNSSRPPAPDAAATKLSTKPKTPSGAKLPPSPCPKCQQMHWLRECPKATDAEKETLRKKLREANQAKRARLKRLGECLPVPG
ncbi:hypothetical protein PR001_g33419, partial [Phytophthora rubi]